MKKIISFTLCFVMVVSLLCLAVNAAGKVVTINPSNMFICKELRFAFFDFRAIVIALFQDIRVKRMRLSANATEQQSI